MVTNRSRLDTPVSFPRDNKEWHHFLEGHVQDALKIREYVESRPKTSTTFTLKMIDGIDASNIPDGVVKLSGAWKLPGIFSNNKPQKWVNPHASDAVRYAECIVTCACGIPMLKQEFGSGIPQASNHQDHKDCTLAERFEARAELIRNRAEIVRDAYQHGHNFRQCLPRLGYQTASLSTQRAAKWGVDIPRQQRLGREKLARTCMVLGRRHSPQTIGEVFGLTKKATLGIIRLETKSNAKDLYSIRRKA